MNGDIRPPKRPEVSLPAPQAAPPADPNDLSHRLPSTASPTQDQPPAEVENHEILPQPLDSEQSRAVQAGQKRKHWFVRSILTLLAMVLLVSTLVVGWLYYQYRPVSPGSEQLVSVTVPQGSTAVSLGQLLEDNELVRNAEVFSWYVRISGIASELQAGQYRLSQGSSVGQLASELTKGTETTFSMTFIPGKTLEEYREVFVEAGFSEQTIDQAFAKNYDRPLFADAPSSADLEGYIYPETYQFASDATVESILEFIFDEYESVIDENSLVAAFKREDLTLFEGITLASIIEREAANNEEMALISQVFHLRLDKGMPLGSDPTYQYIADKTGVPRDTKLDSPYNTRIVTGLTPGPIASPSEAALVAASSPAKSSYLYFVHGDDGKIYPAYTNEEHEQNVAKYCIDLCKQL